MLRSFQLEKPVFVPVKAFARRFARPAATAALLFLLMHAQLPGDTAPLATAMMGAALSAGIHPAAVAGGCLLGMARTSLSDIPLPGAVSCALLMALQLLPKRPAKACVRSRTAFFSGLSCMLPAMVKASGAAIASLLAFACAALAAAAAPYMLDVLEFRPGRKRLTAGEKCGCALLMTGCIAGLEHLCSPLAQISALLTVLLAPGFAPASGILAGLGLCMGGAGIAKLASLSLCALFSGWGAMQQRWQRSIAVFIAAVLAQLLSGPGALDVRWALCAAAVYPLLPGKMLRALEEIAAPTRESICDPARIAQEATAEQSRKLTALADAFSIMAGGSAAPPDVPDEQALIQEMRTRLCAGCIHYGPCWAGEHNRAVRLLCALIGEALERTDAPPGMRILFSDGEIPPDVLRICRRGRMIPDRLGLMLRDFAQKRRSEIKRCENNRILHLQLMQAGEILRDLARKSPTPAPKAQLQAALENAGLGFCQTLPLQKGAYALVKMENWNRDEIRRACGAVSRSLSARFLPHAEGPALRLVRAPKLRAEAAASCQSGIAGEVCGDSHIIRMLDENRLLLAISDGMGSGEAASEESARALKLLLGFLDAGISRGLALETVNRLLLEGSGEEIFATMDLCVIDLSSGAAEMTKLAACRTLVLRDNEISRIDGGRLPLGILENVQAPAARIRLRAGDVLLMGSDGVMEAGDIAMAERILLENAHLDAEALAELLVREASMRRSARHRDDLTCICARITG